MGINGALATKSPSGANNAQEKSSRSLIFVLIEVCCKDRPIASATLMKRFANSVSNIGSGPLLGVLVREAGVSDILREIVCRLKKIGDSVLIRSEFRTRSGTRSRRLTRVIATEMKSRV